MENPKVSVCMPTYNRARYIGQAIGSVLGQTLQDFEIIIFDDGSTDETRKIVEKVADPRIRYFQQPRNVGIAATRNRCLRVARGEYLGWLDSDDVYLPHMLATQSAVLDQHRQVGMVYGVAEIVDADGGRLPDWPVRGDQDVVLPGSLAFRELLLGMIVVVPTVLVRRSCHDRVGGFTTDLRNCSEDWDMWLRIALHCDVAYTARTVAQYRWHGGNTHQDNLARGQVVRTHANIIKRVFAQYPDRIANPEADLEEARAALAAQALISVREACGRGDRWIAVNHAVEAYRAMPSLLSTRAGVLFLPSLLRGDELAVFNHGNDLLCQLLPRFAGTGFGRWIQKVAIAGAEWKRTVREVAQTIRSVVPASSRIVTVDKEDPTLLALSARSGWHFPDRRLLPGGYPADSSVAIDHLRQLHGKGAEYIVFPDMAFWWLEYYTAFREHLDRCHQRVWTDESCIIYQLTEPWASTGLHQEVS
jgi:GT2 family glycosyltransferase